VYIFRRWKSCKSVTQHFSKPRFGTRLAIEPLVRRELLAIMWANPATATFDDFYDDHAALARSIVERAIADWNEVITNFNYAEDSDGNPNNDLNNTFNLSVIAESLSGSERGIVRVADTTFNSTGSPIATTVRLDDNGGGSGWFFDKTP
jgi:hypothetical protein